MKSSSRHYSFSVSILPASFGSYLSSRISSAPNLLASLVAFPLLVNWRQPVGVRSAALAGVGGLTL